MKFYEELAEYYDKIYHYVDYERQAKVLFELITTFKRNTNKKILDIACGTGSHTQFLEKRGLEVTGVDASEKMLEVAKRKGLQATFVLGDMRDFSLKEKFGAAIIMFNSILYNKNENEMKQFLRNVYAHLEQGGVLIFDAVDKKIGANSKPERGYHYEDENLEIDFIPQWIYEQGSLRLEIDFVVNGKRIHDLHEMGSFSLSELKALAQECGFKVTLLEKDYREKNKIYNKDTTALFVCEKV